MNAIAKTLQTLHFAAPQSYRTLTLFPLISPAPAPQGYLTLDEALAQQLISISELTQGGVVPELSFANLSDQPVLLLDGEELIGAKQNRVLNITILAAGLARIVIPVSCVERGRWQHVSRNFQSAQRHMYARGRAAKMEQVSQSMRSDGSRRSDQSAVWEEISAKSARLGSVSSTDAMAAMYEQARDRLDDYTRAFPHLEGQVGAVFALNDRIVGAELFDSAAVFGKLMSKLVGSYAMDAIEEGEVPDADRADRAEHAAREFLARIMASDAEIFPAVGEGQDLRLRGRGVSGGALFAHERLVHLSAFAV